MNIKRADEKFDLMKVTDGELFLYQNQILSK